MNIDAVLDLKPGDKVQDVLSGEELMFFKYDRHTDNHVLCTDVAGTTVWIVPSRLERIIK